MASSLRRRNFLRFDVASSPVLLGTAALSTTSTPAGSAVEDRRPVQDA